MEINLKELKGLLDGAGYHLLPQDHESEIHINDFTDRHGELEVVYTITIKI